MKHATPEQLLMYIDAVAPVRVARHIASCDKCLRKMEELERMDNVLSILLYRATCPSAHTLGKYHLGMVSFEQAASIEEHLKTCAHCRKELMEKQNGR